MNIRCITPGGLVLHLAPVGNEATLCGLRNWAPATKKEHTLRRKCIICSNAQNKILIRETWADDSFIETTLFELSQKFIVRIYSEKGKVTLHLMDKDTNKLQPIITTGGYTLQGVLKWVVEKGYLQR